MSELLKLRLRQNLTQEELAAKAGVSVRTIQRIENGVQPKGYTLKALANALAILPQHLLDKASQQQALNPQLVKWINLSALPFVALPPLNILAPLLLTAYKKQSSPLTKQIIAVQLAWTIGAVVVFMLSVFSRRWFALSNTIILLTMTILVLTNLYIILRNAVELDRHNKLHLFLTVSFL